MGFPSGSGGKESACNAGDPGLVPELGRFPWRMKWQPTPVFLPEKSHGQRNLESCNPWCHKKMGHNLLTKQQQVELENIKSES